MIDFFMFVIFTLVRTLVRAMHWWRELVCHLSAVFKRTVSLCGLYTVIT